MYDRQITPDQVLTFGVSGMLYRNGLIIYDHQTESLWSHILGQAISGEFQGTQLTFIPALQTSWENWKELHPDTQVVNPNLFGPDPYDDYYISGREGVIGRPAREGAALENQPYPKEYVIGVRLGGQARAYPFSVLNEEPVINDQLGDVLLVVFFDKATTSGAAFDRHLADGTTLTFAPADTPQRAIDQETKSEWDIFTGQAVGGPLKGQQLTQVPITYAFWFGWVDYHGKTTVYGLK